MSKMRGHYQPSRNQEEKSITLDDLELPLCTLFQNTYLFRSPQGQFELLRHRAFSLRQYGFIVYNVKKKTKEI